MQRYSLAEIESLFQLFLYLKDVTSVLSMLIADTDLIELGAVFLLYL